MYTLNSQIRQLAVLAMVLLQLAVFWSCDNEKDEENPRLDNKGLTFSRYDSNANQCYYSFSAKDNTAIKSVRIYKNDSLIYSEESASRAEVQTYKTITASCGFTNDSYKIRAEAEDFGGNVLRDTVYAPAIEFVSAPKGGESWTPGASQTISWNSPRGINSNNSVSIQLYRDSKYYTTIAENVSNTGKYIWTPPTTLLAGSAYTIRVASNLIHVAQAYSSAFTIAPYFNITYPASGTSLFTGSVLNITWNDNLIEYKKIDLYKSGKLYFTITSSAKPSVYNWSIPTTPTNLPSGNDYKIRISSASNDNVYAETATFSITQK